MKEYNIRTNPSAYAKPTEEKPIITSKADYIVVCPCCKKMTMERHTMKTWKGYCIACANGKHVDSCEV